MAFQDAVLMLKSYIPTELQVGMYFKTEKSNLLYGNQTPTVQIFELEELPEDTDKFYAEFGYPVEPVIGMQLDSNPDVELAIVATSDQIGWIMYNDDLYMMEVEDVNHILMESNGHIGLYMDDEDGDTPYLEDGELVVICPIEYLYQDIDEGDEDQILL